MDDFESIEGQTPIILTADTVTAAQTSALPEGIYSIINISDYDAKIKIGDPANDVNASTGRRVIAGNEVRQEVKAGRKIGVIGIGAAVTLEIIRIRARTW